MSILTMSPPITSDKGKQGGSCNRTACQRPNSAHHFNRITRAWYCKHCALMIERAARRDNESFYDDLGMAPLQAAA